MSQKKRKLLLHFDQHNTIQIACNIPKRTIKHGLNTFLTSTTWGEEIDGEWLWRCDKPQLEKPSNYPNSITYFKYLEKKFVLNPNDRGVLYAKTNAFTDIDNDGYCFNKVYNSYLEKLKSPSNRTDQPNTIIEDNELYYLIIPVFFSLIKKLKENDFNFTIILRSYGGDSQTFLETVSSVLNGNHECYSEFKNLNIKVNLKMGYIRRNLNDLNKIELEFDGKIYNDEKSVYDKINSIEGICAIRDHFDPWHLKSYQCYYGKPVWLDLNDFNHQHILIDDNIRFDALNDCIANLRMFDAALNDFQNVNFNNFQYFSDSILIQPNLLEFFEENSSNNKNNENYFYNKIELAYKKYTDILSNTKQLSNLFIDPKMLQ